jgi:hypothetical protein
MARRASAGDGEYTGRARKGKAFVKSVSQSFIDRIENLHSDLDSERGSYMKSCRSIREEIDSVYTEAVNAGIKKKVLKAEITKRALKAKEEAIRDNLEAEDQDEFDQLELAIGAIDDEDDETSKSSKGETRPVAH